MSKQSICNVIFDCRKFLGVSKQIRQRHNCNGCNLKTLVVKSTEVNSIIELILFQLIGTYRGTQKCSIRFEDNFSNESQ